MVKKKLSASDDLLKRINKLETRITKLEKRVEHQLKTGVSPSPSEEMDDENYGLRSLGFRPGKVEIESTFGEIGMAWLGNIVLGLGIVFMAQFLQGQGYIFVSTLFGYFAVAFLYLSGYFTRHKLPYMSTLFTYNGHLLLFFVTLRLHFASGQVLLGNKPVALALMLIVTGYLFYLSYKKKSQILAVIIAFMIIVTAVVGNSTHFTLSLLPLIALISVYCVKKFNWWILLNISIILVYITFIIWFLNNPIMNVSRVALSSHHFGHYYLFVTAVIYSLVALLPERENIFADRVNGSIILNGLAFSLLILLFTLSFFPESYASLFIIISSFCIIYSVFLKQKSKWKLASSFYALYGFLALSIAIYGIYKLPLSFLMLSIQSLLVLSIALWFRSRFIVIMNTILFFGLLFAYFIYKEPVNGVNFSFAFSAIISARIMNWKKESLEIRTEFIRNLYLLIGTFMILFGLFKSIPASYVTLSWMIAGLGFFLMSILIANIKYRWIAIATIVVTALKLILFDLTTVSLGLRIIALLVLSVITLGISYFYTSRKKN